MKNIYKNKGFTLAEVLVTLVVIGIVAALAIPSLLQSTQRSELVAKTKKTYAMLTQATNLLVAEGNTMNAIWNTNFAHTQVMNAYKTKLNVIKDCGVNPGCFPPVVYKYLDGTPWANINTSAAFGKMMLSDGTSLLIWDDVNACSNDYGDGPLDSKGCGTMGMDVNGFAPPNQYGRDYFELIVTKDGLIFPVASQYQASSDLCDINGVGQAKQGIGCLVVLLKTGAMNY